MGAAIVANTDEAGAGEKYLFGDAMGMESVNLRFSMDATSKIFNGRGWMEMDARSSIDIHRYP